MDHERTSIPPTIELSGGSRGPSEFSRGGRGELRYPVDTVRRYQELESVLGVELVERNPRGVRLTPAGEEVARRARTVLAAARDLVDSARDAGVPLGGMFRLGVIPTVAPFLLSGVMSRIRDEFPNLKLYLREDMTERLLEKLRAGELDAALGRGRAPSEPAGPARSRYRCASSPTPSTPARRRRARSGSASASGPIHRSADALFSDQFQGFAEALGRGLRCRTPGCRGSPASITRWNDADQLKRIG